MSDCKHLNIIVEGRVQGVSFRITARNEARKYHLNGFVKNLCDGNVYIEAEGTEETLNEFVKWCYYGPPSARVLNVSVTESQMENYTGFDIRH